MELTNENYFSTEANKEFMSASQFKDFLKCEVNALAKINGEIAEEPSKAMMVGSYVDAYFSGELEQFKNEHPEIFNSKTGALKADFEKANDIIAAIENDPMMMEYLSGNHQTVMTGEIAGVKFKIKVDSLLENVIVDQKIMSSINELIWIEKDGRNIKTDFVEAFGYDIQGAIYQRIVEQNTGKKLPFVLAVTTKEDNPDKALIQIDQVYLDRALKLVETLAPRFDAIKQGIIPAVGCGCCPSCRKDLKVTKVVLYSEKFGKEESYNGEE